MVLFFLSFYLCVNQATFKKDFKEKIVLEYFFNVIKENLSFQNTTKNLYIYKKYIKYKIEITMVLTFES